MDLKTAEKLIKHIVKHMERESGLLYPNPDTVIHDAYSLLELIKDEANLDGETIDRWMVEEQASTS